MTMGANSEVPLPWPWDGSVFPCWLLNITYDYTGIELLKTSHFDKWLNGLRDERVPSRIQNRLDRLLCENPGVVEPVGEGGQTEREAGLSAFPWTVAMGALARPR